MRKSRDADRPPASVFSFLPAHSGSRAGAVAAQLSRTLAEGLGDAVLLAVFHPGDLDQARECHSVVCADLTQAAESQMSEAVRASEAIFLVAGSDPASLDGVAEKIDWLRSLDVEDRCALLLTHQSTGASAAEVEELSGVPVCSFVDTQEQIYDLAQWLAASAAQQESLAVAV